jgi:hypothetical protein
VAQNNTIITATQISHTMFFGWESTSADHSGAAQDIKMQTQDNEI